MELKLSYNEVENLIYNKAKKRIKLAYRDQQSVTVLYDVDFLLTKKTTQFYLVINEIGASTITMKYGSHGFAVEELIGAYLSFNSSRVISSLSGNRILLNVNRINKALKTLSVNSIRFLENEILIQGLIH